jgi:hypothetical protein
MTAAGEDILATRAPRRTRVEPSLHWHQAFGVSGRMRRYAKKWPWAWWCTECDDAYGARRTEPDAQAAADEHERAVHGWTGGER